MAKRTRLQRLILVCTLCLIEFPDPAAFAQQPPETRIIINLKDEQSAANWPVTVKTVTIAGKVVRLGGPIAVSGKWIGKTVVTLRNDSPKIIAQVGMYLTFPESGNGSSEHPYEAVWSSLGLVPKVVYTDRSGHYHPPPSFGVQPSSLRVPPGGLFDLSFSRDGDAVQTKLGEKRMTITTATLSFTTIYFADDSRWSAGTYALPPHPMSGAWTMVKKEEFFRGAGTVH